MEAIFLGLNMLIPWRGSWCAEWEGAKYFCSQWPASRTLIQSRQLHHVVCDPCTDNSPMRVLAADSAAAVWKSFGQVATSRLTILELAVYDCCYPHSLVDIGCNGVVQSNNSWCSSIQWHIMKTCLPHKNDKHSHSKKTDTQFPKCLTINLKLNLNR